MILWPTVLIVFLTLIAILIIFIYEIWINEGWRHGLVHISYVVIFNFIPLIILNFFNIKDINSRVAVSTFIFAIWDIGLYTYIRLNHY